MKGNVRISRTALQGMAYLSMFFDHFACRFLAGRQDAEMGYLFLRILGRIAFPLFCFLLVQGFLSTGNVRKYLLRLLILAVLSEVPYDLLFHHTMVYLQDQNVIFTLAISLAVLILLAKVEKSPLLCIFIIFAGVLLAIFLKTDYSYMGVLYSVVMYRWRGSREIQFVILCVLMGIQGWLNPFQILSLPLIFCCPLSMDSERSRNGGCGQIKSNFAAKRIFLYGIYPLHMLFLYFI